MNIHFNRHFDEDLESLKGQIILMGNKVVEMFVDSMTAVKEGNTRLAERVIDADREVNALEIAVDEQCIQLLARYQPAASDLRFVTRGLKIVTDLERIGDLTVNFSQRLIDIKGSGNVEIDLTKMSEVVLDMLKKSLDAFINGNVEMAQEVLKCDDIVDEMTERYVTDLLKKSVLDHSKVDVIFSTASMVRYLERVADHSTNIAELTVYMIHGHDIRHNVNV